MGGAPRADITRRLRLGVALGCSASALFLSTSPASLLALLGIAACCTGPVAVLWTERPRLITAVQLASGVLSSLCLAALAASTGGAGSVAMLAFLAAPLLIGVICAETPFASLVAGVTMGITGGATLSAQGSDAGLLAVVGLGGPLAGLLGLCGSLSRRAELLAERARRIACEERALLQRQREEAERFAHIGQLAARVAHKINNPLAFVTSNLSFLSRALEGHALGDDRPEIIAVLGESDEGLTRIKKIVGELASLARAPAKDERSCDANASIETAVRIAAVKARGVASFKVEAPSPVPLPINGGRMVQVLVNLLVNAIDAIEANPKRQGCGTVWIELSPRRLVIADDGPGLSPEAKERLFEPFFTTKPQGKGTGLGLALCRQYLSESGFSLSAEGRPGGGARFIVDFG